MVRYANPFAGRYFRYVSSILLFAVLGPVLFWQWNQMISIVSILAAVLCTLGYDLLMRETAKRKASGMVNEEAVLTVHAVNAGSERKGFIIITDRFVLFVPRWKKIKTVLDTEQIVRHEFDGQLLEITAKFPNKHRTFRFHVLMPEKIKSVLDEKSGESLPYKYDKIKDNESV